MSNRIYNKLYVNTNREEGSEKILLGYQYDEKEIRLKKDNDTYFHIPFYTKPVKLKDTALIINGATGGPFPAASDRIFKSQKNHGYTTHHGNPYHNTADGLWFCSWLYKDDYGNMFWLDRMYNPGNFVFSGARRTLLTSGPVYKANNPVFKDIPSQMMLEPSVLYRYFHLGEKSAQELVDTFAGEAKDKLVLNLDKWGELNVNSVSPSNQPKILTKESANTLYNFYSFPERPDKKTINTDSKLPIEITIDYDNSYNPTNEFTVMCWMKGNNWNEMPTTQLFGNHSSKGGYGLYVQNLSSYQFFAIPETHYGHVLYINEDLNGFLDKSVQTTPKISIKPSFVTIDLDQNVIVCNDDKLGTIYKLDNSGELLASTKKTDVQFNFLNPTEIPLQMLIGPNNSIIIRTHAALYTFDDRLNKIEQEMIASTASDFAAYRYKIDEDLYELDITTNVKDVKFIETTKWYISLDGNLYRQTHGDPAELYYKFKDQADTFSIDTENRLWVLHGNNKLSVFDSRLAPLTAPRFAIDIGLDKFHDKKNISFVCTYDKSIKTYEWKCIVFYSNERYIYILNKNGDLLKALDTSSLFDSNLLKTLEQKHTNFNFYSKSDFTGYENRRIFQQLSPYKNKSQLVLKASLEDGMRSNLTYDQFVSRVSLENWPSNSWQHLAITLKNKTFRSFVNGKLASSFSFTGRHSVSYKLQPVYFIGTSGGSQVGFNEETKSSSQIFDGIIGDLKIYKYCLDSSLFEIFLNAFTTANDMYWNMPVPLVQYVEKIQRMFKNKVPGSKSPFYRVKIRGTQITDNQTREIITKHLQSSLSEMHPGYTDFLEIQWID